MRNQLGDPASGNDLELVKKAQTGDRQAFGALVGRYQSLVVSSSFAFTGSFAESEEVAQEVFVSAWMHLGGLREPDRFRSWLFAITRSLSARSRRDWKIQMRGDPTPKAHDIETPSADLSPLDSVISQEEERTLWRALGKIPEDYRVPLVLFYQEGKSIERVSRALDLSENAVKKRLWRGRKMLQESITTMLESALRRSRARPHLMAAILLALSTTAAGTAGAAGSPFPPVASLAAGGRLTAGKAGLLAGAAILAIPMLYLARGGHTPTQSPVRRGEGDPASLSQHALVVQRVPRLGHVETQVSSVIHTESGPKCTDPSPLSPDVVRQLPETLALDFEEEAFPALLQFGQVVPCPFRPDGGHCVISALQPGWHQNSITFSLGETPFLRGTRNQVLSFDYWAGSDVDAVMVEIGDRISGCNYVQLIANPARQSWSHAALSVADFHRHAEWPNLGPPAIVEGDPLMRIELSAGKLGGQAFYVDNIKVTR